MRDMIEESKALILLRTVNLKNWGGRSVEPAFIDISPVTTGQEYNISLLTGHFFHLSGDYRLTIPATYTIVSFASHQISSLVRVTQNRD